MCTPFVVEEVMRRSSPTPGSVDVARAWEATEEPLSEVIVPPDPPASVPQVNVPLAQRSFSVDELQAVRLAPNSEARVSPPVEEALVNTRLEDRRLLEVRLDTVVVASVVVPNTLKRPLVVTLVVDALARVVSPVTFSVDENVPVVPMRAP